MRRKRRTLVDIDIEIRVRAFGKGFVCGVDNAQHGGAKGRTVVETATHEHWRIGFEAGKRSHAAALDEYRKILVSINVQTNKGE